MVTLDAAVERQRVGHAIDLIGVLAVAQHGGAVVVERGVDMDGRLLRGIGVGRQNDNGGILLLTLKDEFDTGATHGRLVGPVAQGAGGVEPQAATHLVAGDHHGSLLVGDGNRVTGKETVLADLIGLVKHDLGMTVNHVAHLAGDVGTGDLHTVNEGETQVAGQPAGVLGNRGALGSADAQSLNLQALEAGVVDIGSQVIGLCPAC